MGEEKKEFRVNAKTVFVTWSQVPEGLTKEHVFQVFVDSDPSVLFGIVCAERHRDEGNHIHACIGYRSKRNFKDARRYDLMGCHPNWKSARVPAAAVAYCRKEDPEPLVFGDLPGDEASFLELARGGHTESAILQFATKHPKTYVVSKPQIESNLRALAPRVLGRSYPLESFIYAPKPFCWSREQCLFIRGDSGTGKTEWAKALASINGGTYCFVRDKEALKEFKPGQTVIFDDFDFTDWPRERVIHLLDVENEAQINVKYSMVRLPAGTPRILTTNRTLAELFPFDNIAPIERRVFVVDVGDGVLFDQPSDSE